MPLVKTVCGCSGEVGVLVLYEVVSVDYYSFPEGTLFYP